MLLIYLLFISSFVLAGSDLLEKLQAIPNIEIIEIDTANHFTEAYQIMFEQPVNHLRPNGAKFKQRIFLSHTDFDSPVVMVTEGYQANKNRHSEVTRILKSNELIVEHRYFGESAPDMIYWKYLSVEQAAADHHRIIETFKQIYEGKWITTGVSKGGQTTLFHRAYYPNDVDVSIPYVAPLNFEQEERKIHTFLENVGTKETRDKILEFQKCVLKNRDKIMPYFQKYCNDKNYTFKYDLDMILEYSVFEYSFAYWQWGLVGPENIPNSDSSPEKLNDHLVTVSDPSFFDTKGMEDLSPFMYQAYTEIGFYGYDTTPFEGLLKYVDSDFATMEIFAPALGKLMFDPEPMRYVENYLKNSSNNFLYIYGENDTWSATAVDIGDKTNAVKMVKKDGSHRTRIRSFEGGEKEKIYSTLENWLDMEIER
ncbi:MAG: hypothetical protein JEY94_13040 [Melioribacteraceae bacterium]|nr:hypothetical protein [Melioribacteraceae bacterium]